MPGSVRAWSQLLLLALLITAASAELQFDDSFNTEWSIVSERTLHPKCVPIPSNMSLCHGIGYELMRLPNLLEHDNLNEVASQANNWNPLVGIRCHPDTQIFLCSMFSPVCLDRVVQPCRSLCENVKAGCEGYMKSYGFPWPEMFRCDKFPEDNDLCIPGITSGSAGSSDITQGNERTCKACQQSDTYEGILHSYCTSDYIVRAVISELDTSSTNAKPGDVELIMGRKKKKFYKKNDSLPKKVYTELADRSAKVFMSDSIGCSCGNRIVDGEHHLIGLKADIKYDIMGQEMVTFYAQFVTPWKEAGSKSKRARSEIKKALRSVRKNESVCEGDLSTLESRAGKSGRKKSKRDRKNRKRKLKQ